ncbi:MAG: hypothetical protein ACI8VI_001154 [Granulosicoccus sp.]|jgi:hypothetical protein
MSFTRYFTSTFGDSGRIVYRSCALRQLKLQNKDLVTLKIIVLRPLNLIHNKILNETVLLVVLNNVHKRIIISY